DPLSPGLTPTSKRWSDAAQARTEVGKTLAELAREDPGTRELYASRQKALEAITVPGSAAAKSGAPAAKATGGNVEQQALQALERGDAAALQNLAESMLGRQAGPQTATGGEAAPAASARIAVPGVLGEPLPDACVPRATALGLE